MQSALPCRYQEWALMKSLHSIAAVALAAGAALISACGGGASGPVSATVDSAPAAVESVVQGTITGFGSVIIDGTRFDDTSAKVAFSVDPNSATPATLGDLKMGHRIDAKLVDGKLADVVVSFAIMGPVDSTDAANAVVVVFGQKIKLVLTGATPTAIEGFSVLSDLAPGDLVKVAGIANADKTVTATRIERKPPEAFTPTHAAIPRAGLIR